MADYDTKLQGVGDGGVCDKIAKIASEEINNAVERSEELDIEVVMGVAKAGNKTKITSSVDQEGVSGRHSLGHEEVNKARREIGWWYDNNFTFGQEGFYDKVDFFALIHTHPMGDPSPSIADMRSTLKWWISIDDFKQVGRNKQMMPKPNISGAVAEMETGENLLNLMEYTGKKDRVKMDNYSAEELADKLYEGRADLSKVPLYLGDRGVKIDTRWQGLIEMVRSYGRFCETVI